MGISLIDWYRNKVKCEWKFAFISAIVIGLLVHIFRFVNVLPNHDAIFNQYNSQNMIGSGRWFLSVACGLSGYFAVPWLNGMLSVLYLALTATVLVEIFRMTNRLEIILTSGLLVTFPAVTETFYFGFTSDGYMLAMLMATISVLITRIHVCVEGNKKIFRFLVSAGLLCLVCATYQAYVSFALILLVCYAVTEFLECRYSAKEYFVWILSQIVTYVIGMLTFFVIWKLLMRIQGAEATTFRGINTIGTFSIQNIKVGIYTSVVATAKFFTDNFFESGFTVYACLNVLFGGAAVFGGIGAAIKSGIFRRPGMLLLVVVCICALPFIACMWSFVSVDAYYSVRMLQSLCIVYVFVLDVFVKWNDAKKGDALAVLLSLIIFSNAVSANVFYNGMSKAYERSYASMTELSTRIHLLDDGTMKYIAVVGNADDEPVYAEYLRNQYRNLGILDAPEYSIVRHRARIPVFLATFTDFSLTYYEKNGLEYPIVDFGGTDMPVPKDWCFRFPLVSVSVQNELQQMQDVRDMGNWPASDSVKVFGDIIVVKIGDCE